MKFDLNEIGIKTDEIKNLVVEAIVDRVVTNTSVDDNGYAHERHDFEREIDQEVRKIISDKAMNVIDTRLQMVVDEILVGTFQPVDNWGEPKGTPTTLRDMIKDRSVSFLQEKVDRDGRKTDYSAVGTRIDVAIGKAMDEHFSYALKKELDAAVSSAKLTLQKQVADYIAKQILKA